MKEKEQIKNILLNRFSKKHIEASLGHYLKAIKEFQESNWEPSLSKISKFIEAILKCLWVFCNQPLPPSRQFKVKDIVNKIEKQTSLDDSLRLTIPRACVYIYDITSNRGARHDPQEIDPNKMDATVAISVSSWILAELVRFAKKGSTPDLAGGLIEALMEKQMPYFEEIDGRVYINIDKLSAAEVGLLLLYRIYPKRISRAELIGQIIRHGIREDASRVAVSRLSKYIDEVNDNWKIRGIGRAKAIKILSNIRK
jgi:hypothetical protein